MHGSVIRESHPAYRIDINAIPQTLEILAAVDSIQNSFEFEVRVVREINQTFAPLRIGVQEAQFKNLLELGKKDEKYIQNWTL